MDVKELRVVAQDLQPGETIRDVCPYCKGGQSKEKSFVVGRTDTGKMFVKCYRSKCGWFQLLSLDKDGIVAPRLERKKNGAHYNKTLHIFTRELEEYFETVYGLTKEECYYQGWRWAPEDNRVYMPICNETKSIRGYVLRSIDPKAKSKALTFRTNYNEPLVHWSSTTEIKKWKDLVFNADTCVIVEDQISAAKISPLVQGIALLGHYLDYERMIDVADLYDNAIIALDDDCFGKSIKYLDDFKALFSSLKVWKLKEDLKYVPQERIFEAINNGKVDFSVFS